MAMFAHEDTAADKANRVEGVKANTLRELKALHNLQGSKEGCVTLRIFPGPCSRPL